MTQTENKKMGIPAHVPAELYWDHSFDAFNRELDDPFLAASRLHDGPDIFWAQEALLGQPGWVLTRHELIQEAFLDYEHFTSTGGAGLSELLEVDWRLIPVQLDPPEHHDYRKIFNPFFTPGAVGTLEPAVRKTCDQLISKFEDKGGCEFISEFGVLFPNSVFLSLMGMPQEMLPQFLAWEKDLIHADNLSMRYQAGKEIEKYLRGFVQEQMENPQTDIMKGMVSAHIKDRPITEDEILGTCYLFYVGGLDTVYSALGWVLRYLASDQALQERLRANPDDIPRAVEEFMRAYGVASPIRRVTKDFEFHGVSMCKGDSVLLPTCLASRDPKAYEDPHTINIDRRARYVSFATGPHSCLGIHLAKREMRIVLEAFLSRFENIRIPEGKNYEYHSGGVLGVDRLPLEWDRIKTN